MKSKLKKVARAISVVLLFLICSQVVAAAGTGGSTQELSTVQVIAGVAALVSCIILPAFKDAAKK